MAKNREIEINGDIGDYSYSMGYVRYIMKELGDGPINVKVTSYGGDVNHALKIKNLFEEHGDVTVEYVGFNASAATIIGHGAKKTRIHEDGLYLIHKPMVWVNTLGYMNEDELEQALQEMKTQKKDAETITLTLAQDYVKSRKMEIKTVMDLMQEARWLSAKETVELGLVDELIPAKGKRPVISNQAIAIMSGAGLPIPDIEKEPEKESIVKMIHDEIKNFFTNNNLQSTMDKQYSFVNKVLNIEGLEVKDGKIPLTVEQILALNKELQAKNEAVTNAESAKTTAETAKATAENSLTDVLNQIDAIDPTVKAAVDPSGKVAAVKAKLAERPGTKSETPQGDASKTDVPKDGADWVTIDQLSHNKAIDNEII
jgi:ATP-dependent protease ClpP protease subunit